MLYIESRVCECAQACAYVCMCVCACKCLLSPWRAQVMQCCAQGCVGRYRFIKHHADRVVYS